MQGSSTVYNWGRLLLPACYAHSRRKAPQPFHRAPRARVACVRVLISVHYRFATINSGPERTPPSARPSRDGRVPQPARTNCLFTFLILCVPVIAFATSERGVNRVCHEAISCARDSPPNAHDAPCRNAPANRNKKTRGSANVNPRRE